MYLLTFCNTDQHRSVSIFFYCDTVLYDIAKYFFITCYFFFKREENLKKFLTNCDVTVYLNTFVINVLLNRAKDKEK
jgi:hypothetical protein